ncbi:hypothetical protein HZH66_015478 [Vespula vulgaris]|uniref:Uncharacterized protein n=1 Tax=Vespula vulgaris TaxID=7454 RepID=A0A834J468_VESVU|nr:hypothetical protein HZH66_015478 [Vespula vulgaris]
MSRRENTMQVEKAKREFIWIIQKKIDITVMNGFNLFLLKLIFYTEKEGIEISIRHSYSQKKLYFSKSGFLDDR